MNALDGIVENLDNATFTSIETRINPINEFCESVSNYLKNIQKAVDIYKRTGVPPKCNLESWETFEVLEDTRQRNSSKENVAPNEDLSNENNTGGRSHKNSIRQTTRSRVKKEKISIINEETSTDEGKMPAPSQPAPKRTKQRKAASQLRIKEEKLEEEMTQEASDCRDSVIIQDVAVPVIDLIDSDGNEDAIKKSETEIPATRASRRTKQKETEKKESKVVSQVTVASIPESDIEEETAKKTETKHIKQSNVKIKKEIESPKKALQNATLVMVNLLDSDANGASKDKKAVKSSTKTKEKEVKKRTRSHSSSNGEENSEKRPKSDSENLQNEGLSTKAINDATFVSKSPVNRNLNTAITMNTTVVVEKPKFVCNSNKLKAPATIDDLMTDDESDDDNKNITKVVTKTVTKALKQGQCESTTSKKTVESSEKNGLESNMLPVRTTRTKTRAQAKQEEEEVDTAEVPNTCTPVPSKLIPKSASTVVKKTIKTPQSSSSSRLIVTKFGSELKASQAEFREREKKRREKAKEESAMIQAQLEERLKKKEKQLKVQQQREAWEKENQKQKEELVKRKMLKIQAIEEKKKELKLKKKEEVRTVQQPIYMTTKPPLLPTEDCYDSDDERNKGRPFKEVLWAKNGPLREMLVCMMAAGDTVKNSFFSRQAETPDLQEIFVCIRPEKLKRTSSAIWHKAPRYTMMPVLEQHFEDFEDDE